MVRPRAGLDATTRAALADLGVSCASILPQGRSAHSRECPAYVDVTGKYGAWFKAADVDRILVRPDDYIFGVARHDGEAPLLVGALLAHFGRSRLSGAGEQLRSTA